MKYLYLIFLVSLNGCFPSVLLDIPDYTKIEDNHKTLVAKETDIGQQTLYENQNLTHYVVESVHMYCSDLVSMDTEKYRCFIMERGQLTQGVHPLTFEASPLLRTVPVKTVN